MLSFQEIADKLSAFMGRALPFKDIPGSAMLEGLLKVGWPPRLAHSAVTYLELIKAGRMAVKPGVPQVLGRPARGFDAWMEANAAALRSAAS